MTLTAVGEAMASHPVSLLYYYPHKEDLEAAVLADTLHRFTAILTQAEGLPTPADRLGAFVHGIFDARRRASAGEERPLAPFVDSGLAIGASDAKSEAAIRSVCTRAASLFVQAPVPATDRERNLARLLIAMLSWADAWLWLYRPSDYSRAAAQLTALLTPRCSRADLGPARVELSESPQPGARRTREALLAAATRLMNRHGFNGVTVNQVSLEAQVTKGAFYHNFADKEALLSTCLHRGLRTLEAELDARREPAPAGVRLAGAVARLAHHQAASEGGAVLSPGVLMTLDLPLRRRLMARYLQTVQACASLIAEGVGDGSIRAIDPTIASHYVLLVVGMARTRVEPVAEAQPSSLERCYLRPALSGLIVR